MPCQKSPVYTPTQIPALKSGAFFPGEKSRVRSETFRQYPEVRVVAS